MKKITILFAFLALAFNTVRAQTIFDFETAVDNGNNVTETIDGITVEFRNNEFTDDANTFISFTTDGSGGISDNVVQTGSSFEAGFSFDQPVDVNSIITSRGSVDNDLVYTFTPTGGSNSVVVVSRGDGFVGLVDLNWVNVTSFTVTSSLGPTGTGSGRSMFRFDFLSVDASPPPPSTVFEFETAVDNGNNVTETIDGITVEFRNNEFTDDANTFISFTTDGSGGISDNVVQTGSSFEASFSFDQPVDVNSIITSKGSVDNDLVYTFTPTGGSNSVVVVSRGDGFVGLVDLNWVNVTSFTVTSSLGPTGTGSGRSMFRFDFLSVNATPPPPSTIFEFETASDNGDNVTETIDGITVTAQGGADFQLLDGGGYGGSTAFVLYQPSDVSSVTFTFDQAVDINSILAMEGNGVAVDYTFTPTGGSNSSVMASVPAGDGISVDLNWTGVTSFTVTTSSGSGSSFTFDNLSVDAIVSPPSTIFEFETASDNGDNVTETIDGITVTAQGGADFQLLDGGGYGGSTAFVLYQPSDVSSVTFTFDQAVDINSILAMEGNGVAVDYTFTPTGGSNSSVMASVPAGDGISVDLNWTGVTSFTVTTSSGSGSSFTFDNLSVDAIVSPPSTIFEFETASDNGDNVTETIDGITVTAQGGGDFQLLDASDYGGSTAFVLYQPSDVSSVTFTFDQAVDINSILAMEGNGVAVDYTFTPTGGSNSSVMASVPAGDGISVDLNWTGVTSFTVTTSSGSGSSFTFDNLSVDAIVSPPSTIFEFETASDNGDNVTETIDGITVTAQGGGDFQLLDASDYGGSTAFVLYQPSDVSSVTFTFDQAVDINSILAMEGNGVAVDYTFTPTGGSNSSVMSSVPSNDGISVDLNWTGVTSFTVTTSSGSGSSFTFDNLSVDASESLSITDDYTYQKVKVYPNPVENMLYIKTSSELKSIKLYNNLGQQILQNNNEIINMSNLPKGMYFLQIISSKRTETKRIIKN